MNIDDVRTLAGAILGPQLEPFGYQDVDVQDYVDSAGEEALQITARLRPDGPLIPGDVFMRIGANLSSALLDQGEPRFPYLRLDHQDDEPLDDGDETAGSGH